MDEAIHRLLEELARVYAENRGTLRALIERSRHDRSLRQRRQRYAREAVARFEAAVLGSERDVCPETRVRVRVGATFVLASLREHLVYREFWPADMRLDTGVLTLELAAAFLGYARSEPTAR